MVPDEANLSMLGVKMSFPPLNPQSANPKSSTNRKTILGCFVCAEDVKLKTKQQVKSRKENLNFKVYCFVLLMYFKYVLNYMDKCQHFLN